MARNPSPILDSSVINRATPPGSMRYFALLYTPEPQRDVVTALFVVDAELRESAQNANHDVAHTRLQWWRQEIDRLVNDNAQHPATRVLASARRDLRRFHKLHEAIVAADMDLARMTYANAQEVQAYCARSGGSIAELIAGQLIDGAVVDGATLTAANRLGALIRASEIIRDVRQDAYDGRLYLPLDTLDQHGVRLEELRAKDLDAPARAVLRDVATTIETDIRQTLASIPPAVRAYLRPLYVLAGLHAELLRHIGRSGYAVGAARIELGAIRKPWAAWRAARRAG